MGCGIAAIGAREDLRRSEETIGRTSVRCSTSTIERTEPVA